MSVVLVINSGSSSFKYQLVETESKRVLAKGVVERIGQTSGTATHEVDGQRFTESEWIPTHTEGFAVMARAFAEHGPALEGDAAPVAVGHRVVHGGARYSRPALVTDAVLRDIDELSALAPLHNPAAVLGLRAAREMFPELPHVTVFDTAFHHTLPPEAHTYAIDRRVAERHRIRRYGFHGTSHGYVSREAIRMLGKPADETRIVSLHLGNGASACAIKGGKSVDTSMGFTPLEGLVMGTRSGDLDPAILVHLVRVAGYDGDDLDALLNKNSGLMGLAGRADMRDVRLAANAGDRTARAALDVVVHRLRQYIGAYAVVMEGLDAIVFTAGIGENEPNIRRETLAGLHDLLGIELDDALNEAPGHGPRDIATQRSRVRILVIPTNEEYEIAAQTLAAVEEAGLAGR